MENKYTCCGIFTRFLITILLVSTFVFVISERNLIISYMEKFIDWMAESPVAGPVCLSLVFMAGEIMFLPGSLLSVGAGFAF